jgi:hypothetical protein
MATGVGDDPTSRPDGCHNAYLSRLHHWSPRGISEVTNPLTASVLATRNRRQGHLLRLVRGRHGGGHVAMGKRSVYLPYVDSRTPVAPRITT